MKRTMIKDNIITRAFLFLVACLSPVFLVAQDVFSLQNCIETGLKQNYDVRIVRNKQQISDNNRTIGNAGFLPSVDFNSGFAGTVNDIQQLPADGSVSIESNGVHNQALNAGVNVNWTIFDGFNIQTNYKRLREMQQMGQLQTRLTIENLIAGITAEYYNYVQQSIRLNNLKSAVRLSKERLRIVEARYNIGNMSRLDLQQARVYFNTDSSKLIRQQETLYASRVKLNQLMAVTNLSDCPLIKDSVIHFDAMLNSEELWQKTLTANTYLLLAEKEKKLSVLELKSAQSQNYPYIRMNAGYGYSQNKYEIATYKRQNNLGFNYGITLGYNLFDGMNRSRKQKNAKLEIETKALELEELQLSLYSDFSNIWMAYENNLGLTNLEKENLRNAVETYEIAIERYKLGDLSGIELREAQNSLLEAEERLVQAQYNTKLCEISLMQISGQAARYLE